MKQETLDVLVVEDQDMDAEYLRLLLSDLPDLHVKLFRSSTSREALAELEQRTFDLIFVDYRLGDGTNGIEFIQSMCRAGHDCPTIVLTGQGNEYVAAQSIREGADDYLSKNDLTAARLLQAIQSALAQHRRRLILRESIQRNDRVAALSLQLAESNVQLAQLGRMDALTQILNRGAWQESTLLEHERAVRYGRPYAILMIDVDHFKPYNDACGHPAGDECLRRIAQAVVNACRGIDLVGRFGGEEFVVLAPETDFEGGLALARRIQQGILDQRIAHPGSPVSNIVTLSVGVSAGPRGGWELVMKTADEALYDAKRGGRNRVCGRSAVVPADLQVTPR